MRRRTRGASGERASEALPEVGVIVDLWAPDGGSRRRTRVEHVEGARLWLVAPLRPAGEVWPLDAGSELEVTWVTDRGLRTAFGRLAEVEESEIPVWVVEAHRVEQTQRRQAYRLDVAVPVALTAADTTVQGTTRDVSETGLRARVPRSLAVAEGDEFALELTLDPDTTLRSTARVMRVDTPDDPELARTEREVGLRLVDLEIEEVETLRRFVLEEQLRRRRRDGGR